MYLCFPRCIHSSGGIFMRRFIVTLAALLATAGLVYSCFRFPFQQSTGSPARLSLVRVWIAGQDASVSSWLRKQATRYEKETGVRVYLRTAPEQTNAESSPDTAPDLLISGEGEKAVALYGYALFYRDDSAQTVTPIPTSLLFIRPSPTPGADPTPAPTPDHPSFSVLLAPEKIQLPGSVSSAHPVSDFVEGKGDAVLLTAEQAKQLPFAVRACPLPDGKGFLPIYGDAASPAGEAFLSYLTAEPSQRALADVGLFSPDYVLYRGIDPVRELIENR